MPHTVVLERVPRSLVVGSSVSWKVSLSDFPASAWTLTYSLVNASNQISIVASDDSNDHLVEIAPTTSDDYIAGEYEYQAHIENAGGTERLLIERGQITIVEDFAAQTSGYDARSWVKKTLDAIKDLIDGKVTKDRANYAVHGRSLSSYSWEEIYTLYADFQAQYKAEQRSKRGRSSSVKVRFSSP